MRITASAIVVGLLLCSGCATSTRPGVIGVERSQLLIVSPDLINEQAASAYASTSSKAQSAGKLNTDADLTARVKGISDKLIDQVGTFRTDARSWKWEVNVFDSDQINAFCYPGGKIAVYTGIITRLNLTDPELAAVIGHEIAHAARERSDMVDAGREQHRSGPRDATKCRLETEQATERGRHADRAPGVGA